MKIDTTTRESFSRMQTEHTLARRALAASELLAADLASLVEGRPSEGQRLEPDEIWRNLDRIARLMPALSHRLSALRDRLRPESGLPAAVGAAHAGRIESRLAEAGRVAGVGQKAAWESYRWADALAEDLIGAAHDLDDTVAALEADLERALED